MIVDEHEYLDFNKIPESRGIPTELRFSVIVGIVCIFIIGGLVAFLSGHGHMWPSLTSTRMDLGKMPPGL
jgi:Mg/Co/Ni transporter MgtE